MGLRDSAKLIIRYPAMLLLPVFTPFTFGPLKFDCGKQEPRKLTLNYGLTALNIVTTVAEFVGALFLSDSGFLIMLPVYLGSVLFAGILALTDLYSCCCCLPIALHKPVRETKDAKDLLEDPRHNQDLEMAPMGAQETGSNATDQVWMAEIGW